MNIQFYSDELDWCLWWSQRKPGSFLMAFIDACFAADVENYELLRPVVTVLMQKYPVEPSVKS